ncbi:MFS transporter [Paraburkholderia acidisoli]|uniref:MFS transporter n=1 Tax=Paraburkholderia acidisoli TaxID=2571748 RepID=A0A7Z2GND9_9BURK|nr:MFS transporter [Paraburkholderia acidisoli]QGZ64750.1 MFS transporter [Paraburkholderia acidisoli]
MAAISESPHALALDPPARTTRRVLALCFLTIVTEGYDIGVMGTIVPSMLADPVWKLTPIEVGAMSSAALFGTLFGSYFISVLTDLIGRKRLLIACVTLFSLSMLGAAIAPSPFIFSVMRFIGGLGLGGVISAAAALTVEYSPAARRNLNFAIMYSGYAIGALVSAVIGIAFLGSHGWRFVVALGALPLLGLPLLVKMLPESLAYLMASGKRREADQLAQRLGLSLASLDSVPAEATAKPSLGVVLREVFSHGNAWSTLCLWVAQIAAVLVIYGLGTWLPQLMRKLGYDLGSSLSFLAIFMLSSAIGGILIGRVGDRLGPRKTIVGGYMIGALAICGLAVKGSELTNYVLVALAGLGSIGVAMVQLGYIASFYRPFARASATGWAVGIGRVGAMAGPMLGAWFASSHLDVRLNFVAFAVSGLVAALAIAVCRPRNA